MQFGTAFRTLNESMEAENHEILRWLWVRSHSNLPFDAWRQMQLLQAYANANEAAVALAEENARLRAHNSELMEERRIAEDMLTAAEFKCHSNQICR